MARHAAQQVKEERDKARSEGAVAYGHIVHGNIRPIVNGTLPHLRAAWWEGFMAECASQMRASIGLEASAVLKEIAK